MITEQQMRSLMHHPVHDADGHRIGTADHLFLNDATGRPEWVTVKTGRLGNGQSFVPVRDAHVVGNHLQVPFAKDKVKDAPTVAVDRGGHLSEQEERRLYHHYGIDWDEAWKTANEPGEGGWAHRDGGDAKSTRTAGAAKATDTAATAPTTGAARPSDTRITATSGTGATGAAVTGAAATGVAATGDLKRDRTGGRATPDDVMTRSEERMRVGVERYETGHARLRKYVVTEEEQQTVPIRHEEVRVEREPITEANRAAAMSDEPIAEAEYDVVLHAERPIVRTEAVPVERVRLVTEEHVEQQTVTGELRKERIEADLPDADAARPTRPTTGRDKGGPATA
ncbi:DUF2382 domain-containing protein [Kitasatospora griseola]|uniref:DUF2382 domain-containing protein n=2 Tax=Kitasatospora griseola TaxID=2064 RepID=UPI003855F9C2